VPPRSSPFFFGMMTPPGKPRSAPGPPARDGRASARPSVARGKAGGVRTYGRGGAMKTVLAIALSLAFPAAAAKEEMEVRNQGAVKAHVWTSTAGLESARVQLRALTALSNDATAWDSRQARALLRGARDDIQLARTHARSLESMHGKGAAEDLRKLDSDLGGALALVDKLQEPIARGVSPKSADTRADNTMLGGAAADRGMPPGKGGDVTHDSGRGQRGGTPQVQQLRDGIKAAWERLEQAKGDLDKVARAFDPTSRLPEP